MKKKKDKRDAIMAAKFPVGEEKQTSSWMAKREREQLDPPKHSFNGHLRLDGKSRRHEEAHVQWTWENDLGKACEKRKDK